MPITNVWAVPAYFGRELIAAPAVLIGLLVARRMVRLMRRRWTIGEPHCRRCGYCLSKLTSDRCPECGTGLTAGTSVIARPVGRRVALGVTVAALLLLTYPAMYIAHVGRVVHPLWPRPLWSLSLGRFTDRYWANTPPGKALVLQGSRIVEKDFDGNTVRTFEPLPVRVLFAFEQVDTGSLMVHIDSNGPESRYIDASASEPGATAWGVYQWARWDPGTGKLIAHRTFGFDGEAWTDGQRVYLIPSKPSPLAPRELEAPAWRCYDATTGKELPPPAWLAAGPVHACLPKRSPRAFTLDWTGRTVGIYDKATGQLTDSLNLGNPPSDPDCPSNLSLTPDGDLVLLQRYGVAPELYDVRTRRLLRTFERNIRRDKPQPEILRCLRQPRYGWNMRLEIRELRTDRLVATIVGSGPRRRVELRFSPDERCVYCRGRNWSNIMEWSVYELRRTMLSGIGDA